MARSNIVDTLPALIAGQTARRLDRPLVTVYDDPNGARTELSYATTDNWASKTANLLAEEFGIGPGAIVALDLTGHWTTVAITLACWKAGAAVRCDGEATAALVCCHESRIDRHPYGPVLVVGDGLRAEPVRAIAVRDDLVLLGEDVHGFADDYDDPAVTPPTPAIVSRTAMLDHAGVLSRAAVWRDALTDGVRVALAAPLDAAASLTLLAGLIMAGGSAVAVRPPPTRPPWQRWTAERVTAVVGPSGTVPDTAGGVPDGITVVDWDLVGPHPDA